MIIHWRSLLLTIALSLATGWIGAQIGIRYTMIKYPGPASGAIESVLRQTLPTLQLTDAQQRAIDAISAQYDPQSVRLRQQVRAVNAELASALVGSVEDDTQIESSAAHLGKAVNALQQEAMLQVQQVRKVLTAPQRAVLDAKVSEALHALTL